ncbi:ankyrin repeat-containing domain protein [Chaetomium sp. MPI-CAGE-AT-0009]|nr:ankyrin repeat-containing domain protein [Chaetomium sp. MPI-CAGE-AT-0009]
MFSDLEREFARGSTVSSVTGPGAVPEQGIAAETPVVQMGSPCQPEKETSMEHTAVVRVEALEHSPGTLSLLGQSARSTSSSSSSTNGSGWLGALHMAAKRGHSGIIRFLLQQNVDINERDSDGLTALMYAAAAGHEEVAELLLAQGARLSDVDSHHRSALHWAALSRHADLLRLLLRHATSDPFLIDGYDDCGQTPLHTAVDMGFEPGVSILLEFGANVHSRARKG